MADLGAKRPTDPLLEIYLERRANLVRFFTARTGSPSVAEDLAQELYVKLASRDPAITAENPVALIYRIATNVMLDRARGEARSVARESAWRIVAHASVGGDDVAAGLKLNGSYKKSELDDIVEKSLRGANLWNEVKDRLARPGSGLSGGQQQRLCIARAIAVEPDVLLMDEPCSALDPISTLAIEDLIGELKERFTIVIVTHNMQQAARVSDRTAFFNLAAVGKPGRLVEIDDTERIFSNPSVQATEDYISGRFG